MAKAKHKKTNEEIKREVAQLKEEIEALRQRAREQRQDFAALDDEQLVKKVRGDTSKSPFFYAEAWTSFTSPGSTASYSVYVRNPDPISHFPVYVTVFFGLSNFFGVDQGWIGRDKRWPEFSSDRLDFPANSSQSFSFLYTTPTGLPLGTYNGNSVLWEVRFFDVGVAFDRAGFDVKLL